VDGQEATSGCDEDGDEDAGFGVGSTDSLDRSGELLPSDLAGEFDSDCCGRRLG